MLNRSPDMLPLAFGKFFGSREVLGATAPCSPLKDPEVFNG